MSDLCPCGSGLVYAACCQPLHLGQPAATPEALMRSRYSAFVREDTAYLLASWDDSTRPPTLELAPATQWLGLQIVHSQATGDDGEVEFVAHFREGDEWFRLDEISGFRRGADGYWRYLDGNACFDRLRPGRNDDCPCNSGRKFKKCCG